MLDLKKLEEKLDIALSHETSESITLWLQEKRIKDFILSSEDGNAENMADPEPGQFS